MHLDRQIRLFQSNKSYNQKLFLALNFLEIGRVFITASIWFTYIGK